MNNTAVTVMVPAILTCQPGLETAFTLTSYGDSPEGSVVPIPRLRPDYCGPPQCPVHTPEVDAGERGLGGPRVVGVMQVCE